DGVPQGGLLVLSEAGPLRRARSFYSRVLAAAARELQAPLAALRLFSGLARRATGEHDAECAGLYLERLDRQAQRLDYLVGELHDLVDVLSGSAPLKPLPLDLSAEIRSAVDVVARAAREHVFVIDAPGEAIAVVDSE